MSGLEFFDDVEENQTSSQPATVGNFFGCYLLVSINPRHRGKTYIGFTVNPKRRIGQHNAGRQKGGAKSTSGRGPWDMVLIVHGFPNDISALRFEWAWQNPKLSRRLAKHASVVSRQGKESPFQYRLRLLGFMLRTGPWCRLGLTLRWINQDYCSFFPPDYLPPLHMPIAYGPVDLQSSPSSVQQPTDVVDRQGVPDETLLCQLCQQSFQVAGPPIACVPLKCPHKCPLGQWHVVCLARSLNSVISTDQTSILPLTGQCPSCRQDLFWPQLIDDWKRSGRSSNS